MKRVKLILLTLSLVVIFSVSSAFAQAADKSKGPSKKQDKTHVIKHNKVKASKDCLDKHEKGKCTGHDAGSCTEKSSTDCTGNCTGTKVKSKDCTGDCGTKSTKAGSKTKKKIKKNG